MVKTEEALRAFGLEENETKVYLALLDYGEATATQLSERTGLGRVHMYQITDKLIHRGAASSILKGGVKYFLASAPETLLKDLEQKEEDLRAILPELKKRQNTVNFETKAEVLRGKEGVNTVLKMILAEGKDYVMLGGGEQCCGEEFSLMMSIFVKRCEKEKLNGRLLEREEAKFFVGKNEEYRFIPKEFLSSTTLAIWGNKMAIFVWTKPYYMIIVENKEVARSNLSTFDYLWKSAKRPSGKDIILRRKF